MKSLVWNYFEAAVNSRAKCNFCGQLIGVKNSCTSGMRRHLNKHPSVEAKLKKEEKERAAEKTATKRPRLDESSTSFSSSIRESQATLSQFTERFSKYPPTDKQQQDFDEGN